LVKSKTKTKMAASNMY